MKSKTINALFIIALTIMLFASCNNSGGNKTSDKELELQKKELELKERELALKEKELQQTTNSDTKANSTESQPKKVDEKSEVNPSKANSLANSGGLQIPAGYRLPLPSDITKGTDWYSWKKDMNITEPYHIVGDFNGDGSQDHAYILLKGTTAKWGLFCFFKTNTGYEVKQLQVGTEVKTEDYVSYTVASRYAISRWKKGEKICLYDEEGFTIKTKKTLPYDAIGFAMLEVGDPSAYVYENGSSKFKLYFGCME